MTMSRLPALARVSSLLGFALLSANAAAVGTRRFQLEDAEDFKGGDLKGVAVDSGGSVRAGLNLGNVAIQDAAVVWSALPQADGSVLLGTGSDGKLLQVRGAQTTTLADTPSLALTSMVRAWGGAVLIGTMPDGKILRWDGGKLTEFATLKGAEHIWQLAYDAKTDALFAATGPEGKLFRITRAGAAQVYFDAEEQHLMSVAVAPDGTVFAGASDKAKLYRVSGPGRAAVLYDFGRTEVHALAIGKKGELYAIANELPAGSYGARRSGDATTSPAEPAARPSKTKGKGTLYVFDAEGTPTQLLDDKEEHYVSLTVGDDGKPYVGTGVEGRIYSVDEARNSVLVADVEERQVTAVVLAGKTQFVAGSDPAVLRPVRGVGGPDAVWTSKVFDAGLRARFGRVDWVSSGTLEVSTRTGNTREPDDTWTPWSRPLLASGVVESAPGRFVQVRARFTRGDAVLSELTIPFITDNLRAVITKVDAAGSAVRKGEDADGVKASGGPIAEKSKPEVVLSWKVDNPDKDDMRYRLQYRLLGTDTWYDLLDADEKLTSESYTWDTSALPEGRYRVRVIATDELANPPARVKRHELESGIVLVDNTAPTIEGLQSTPRKVSGRVLDGVGPVQRIEVSQSGKDEWYPIEPADGIFDEQREEFEFDPTVYSTERPVMLTIRAYDHANNAVVRHVALK
jgi:hypothetical protein